MERQQEQAQNLLNQAVDLGIDYGLDLLGALVILIAGWALAGWVRRKLARASLARHR